MCGRKKNLDILNIARFYQMNAYFTKKKNITMKLHLKLCLNKKSYFFKNQVLYNYLTKL